MVKKTITRLTVLGFMTVSLAACSIFPKSPELTVYQLPQRDTHTQSAPTRDAVLRVAIPYSRNYLDTQRVVVITPERNLAVMDGIRWEDLSPVIVRDSLIRAIRSADIYSAVTNDETTLGDYSLRSDLQDFQLDYSVEPAEVVISLDANLVNLKTTNKLTHTRNFSARSPLRMRSNEAVIEAFADANHQIQQQIIQWLITLPRGR